MVFNSLTFLVFFAVVLAAHHLPFLSWRTKKVNLLVASYVFYAAWNPPFILLLWASTVVDWFIARAIWASREKSRAVRRSWLVISVAVNIGFTAYAHRLFREGESGIRKRSQEFFLALFLLLVCLSVHVQEVFNRQPYITPFARVAFVQPYIPQAAKWDEAQGPAILEVLEKTTLAADQNEIEVELSAAADAAVVKFEQLAVTATSKYAGTDISVESPAAVLEVKAP